MSIEQLMSALRALTDPLALLFLAGSLTMLWALWHVLRHDIDLTDDAEDGNEEPKGKGPDPSGLAGREKPQR